MAINKIIEAIDACERKLFNAPFSTLDQRTGRVAQSHARALHIRPSVGAGSRPSYSPNKHRRSTQASTAHLGQLAMLSLLIFAGNYISRSARGSEHGAAASLIEIAFNTTRSRRTSATYLCLVSWSWLLFARRCGLICGLKLCRLNSKTICDVCGESLLRISRRRPTTRTGCCRLRKLRHRARRLCTMKPEGDASPIQRRFIT
jgi:hypothetical protein